MSDRPANPARRAPRQRADLVTGAAASLPLAPRRRHVLFGLSAAVLGGLGAGLSACERRAPLALHGVDISGAPYGQHWRLQDQTGAERSPADFRGLIQLFYFGFTQCPDICPATLGHLRQTLTLLGPAANEVRVLFVTVDGQTDRPAVLQEYLKPFGAAFIGLTGSDSALQDVAKDFRVYARRKEGGAGFEHAGFVYAFDRSNRPRVLYGPDATPQAMADDIRLLLKDKGSAIA